MAGADIRNRCAAINSAFALGNGSEWQHHGGCARMDKTLNIKITKNTNICHSH